MIVAYHTTHNDDFNLGIAHGDDIFEVAKDIVKQLSFAQVEGTPRDFFCYVDDEAVDYSLSNKIEGILNAYYNGDADALQ